MGYSAVICHLKNRKRNPWQGTRLELRSQEKENVWGLDYRIIENLAMCEVDSQRIMMVFVSLKSWDSVLSAFCGWSSAWKKPFLIKRIWNSLVLNLCSRFRWSTSPWLFKLIPIKNRRFLEYVGVRSCRPINRFPKQIVSLEKSFF